MGVHLCAPFMCVLFLSCSVLNHSPTRRQHRGYCENELISSIASETVSTPSTLCSSPSTLCGTPGTPCSIPSTLCSTPGTLHSTPSTVLTARVQNGIWGGQTGSNRPKLGSRGRVWAIVRGGNRAKWSKGKGDDADPTGPTWVTYPDRPLRNGKVGGQGQTPAWRCAETPPAATPERLLRHAVVAGARWAQLDCVSLGATFEGS